MRKVVQGGGLVRVALAQQTTAEDSSDSNSIDQREHALQGKERRRRKEKERGASESECIRRKLPLQCIRADRQQGR
jgi:hypothetical protein